MASLTFRKMLSRNTRRINKCTDVAQGIERLIPDQKVESSILSIRAMTTLGDRLRRFGDGEIDNVLLSRADARYLADLVGKDNETEVKGEDYQTIKLAGQQTEQGEEI